MPRDSSVLAGGAGTIEASFRSHPLLDGGYLGHRTVRLASLVLVLLPLSARGATGQDPCAPASTIGLRLFEAGSEIRFEPSSVVRVPGECAVLVFSDKSETLEAFRFQVLGDRLGTGERIAPAGAPGVVQLEAAALVEDGDAVLVVTSGTFKDAPSVEQSREDRALMMRWDSAGSWRVAEDLSASWERFLRGLREQAGGWLKVEALTAMGDRYLVGLRQFGDAHDRFDYGLRIAVWDPSEPNIRSVMADPRSVTVEEQGDGAGTERPYMRTYGVSSLECARGQSGAAGPRCYMLVSSEDGPGIHDVKSLLLSFRLEELADATSLPGRVVACFWNKAEGLTLLDEDLALVVFDSDRNRKGGGGSDLFPLQDHQDYYWIGSVAEPPLAGADEASPPCVGP